MPKHSDRVVRHLQDRFLEVLAADTAIQETTDDQLVLWLASDHLDQAEHDLRLAIKYSEGTRTLSARTLLSVRMQLIAIAMLRKYISLLLTVPPQLLLTAAVSAHLAIMLIGMPWLAFGLHLNYWLLILLTLVNVIALPFWGLSNQQVTLILNNAKQLALSAQERLPELPSRTDT